MDFSNRAVKKAVAGAKSPRETLDRLRGLAEDYANALLHENDKIRLIALIGSIGRELSGEMPCGAAVWEGSDIDLLWWDNDTDFEQLVKVWKDDTPHWLSGAYALFDPDNLLPKLKDECGRWSLESRKKLVWHLWMENLAIKRCALAFYEQGNIPTALWAARKAYELVLDVTLLLDDFAPCTPKYDWHSLREEVRRTLVGLHTVDASDTKAVH